MNSTRDTRDDLVAELSRLVVRANALSFRLTQEMGAKIAVFVPPHGYDDARRIGLNLRVSFPHDTANTD